MIAYARPYGGREITNCPVGSRMERAGPREDHAGMGKGVVRGGAPRGAWQVAYAPGVGSLVPRVLTNFQTVC